MPEQDVRLDLGVGDVSTPSAGGSFQPSYLGGPVSPVIAAPKKKKKRKRKTVGIQAQLGSGGNLTVSHMSDDGGQLVAVYVLPPIDVSGSAD